MDIIETISSKLFFKRGLLILIIVLFHNLIVHSQNIDLQETIRTDTQGVFILTDLKLLYSSIKDTGNFLVSERPMFRGGSFNEFLKYIKKEIKYPIVSYFKKHSKYLDILFTIDKKGKVLFVEIPISSGILKLDKEITRVYIQSTPNWIPMKINGKPIDIQLLSRIKLR